MRLHEEGIRVLISAALVSFIIVTAVYLWFIEILSEQREFGVFLGAELAAFSMVLYLSTRPTYGKVKKTWFLIGCLSLAFFLTLAIMR